MTDLAAARAWARTWLFEQALPLWWEVGADRVRGGWFEMIGQDGRAVADATKRIRVQGRQVFVYAEAGRLGWDGPWRAAVDHGIAYLLDAYKRPDGLFRRFPEPTGDAAEDYDIYDQAFVLLALASAYRARGGDAALLAEAEALHDAMTARLAHPRAGFRESFAGKLPLRSNPHMHLLEALLAWLEQTDVPAFRARAQEIVALALDRMIDPATGAIAEYFDDAWGRLPGAEDVREPGHQFEWAYLLTLAGRVLGGDHAAAATRLAAFGTRHGVDRAREAAIFAVDAAGTPVDRDARLWAQTERLRTALVLGAAGTTTLDAEAAAALGTLRRFLDVPVPGLWLDRLRPDDTFLDQPAPASSLYHIVTGLAPLVEARG